MRTVKQIEASRENGAKSHGPVTEEGKAISARNNTRHGLLAQAVVIIGESPESFTALLDKLVAEHQPQILSEMIQVEKMAVAYWPPSSATKQPTNASTIEPCGSCKSSKPTGPPILTDRPPMK